MTVANPGGGVFGWIGEVNGKFLKALMEALVEARGSGCKRFMFLISSAGGDPHAALAAYDLLRTCGMRLSTVMLGDVASAATILGICGDKRYAYPHASFYTHLTAWHPGKLTTDEANRWPEYMHFVDDNFYRLLAKHSPKDEVWWRNEDKDGGLFICGGEALVEAGLADEVLK